MPASHLLINAFIRISDECVLYTCQSKLIKNTLVLNKILYWFVICFIDSKLYTCPQIFTSKNICFSDRLKFNDEYSSSLRGYGLISMHQWHDSRSEKQRWEQLWKAIDIPAQVGVDVQMDKHNVTIPRKLYGITPAGVWCWISSCF